MFVIVALAVIVFAVSATFDIFDKIISFLYRHDTWELDELFTVAVFLVFATGTYARRRHRELVVQVLRRQQAEEEKARLIPELENARANISTLRKLLPICSSCRRVRDDKGYWSQVEVYMENHFLTRLDDGICPDCAKRQFAHGHEVHRRESHA